MFDAGCGLYDVADMYDANGSPRSCPLTEHALKTEVDLQQAKARYSTCDRSGLKPWLLAQSSAPRDGRWMNVIQPHLLALTCNVSVHLDASNDPHNSIVGNATCPLGCSTEQRQKVALCEKFDDAPIACERSRTGAPWRHGLVCWYYLGRCRTPKWWDEFQLLGAMNNHRAAHGCPPRQVVWSAGTMEPQPSGSPRALRAYDAGSKTT